MGASLRVEELARRADVSVDTIRFYQKRRLLPPPVRTGRIAWYGAEHEERLQRIRDLQRQGFSLAVIRRLLDGDLDPADAPLAAAVAGAAADADAGPESLLTLDELAERSGVPAPLLEAVVREGILVPQRRDGEARFTPADAEIVGNGLRLLEAGLPLPELLALARRHDDATRPIAEAPVSPLDAQARHLPRTASITNRMHRYGNLTSVHRAQRATAWFLTVRM